MSAKDKIKIKIGALQMAFDKEKYWARRNNQEKVLDKDGEPVLDEEGNEILEHKPLRGQGDKPIKSPVVPSGDAEISFTSEGMVAKNRAYRRKRVDQKEFRKKGFTERLNAILHIRKKNGKKHKKYLLLDNNKV